LPSNADWNTLDKFAGFSSAKLKAESGWNSCGPSGSGSYYSCEDTYGFSALPGGNNFIYIYDLDDVGNNIHIFDDGGNGGYWWSATEDNDIRAYYRDMRYDIASVGGGRTNKLSMYSVRCVQD